MPSHASRLVFPGDALSEFALPRLVQLQDNLVGAAFDVMKLLPARHIIDTALLDGRISHRTTVVETTSGTFGLGLAMVCAVRGIRLHLVSDPAVDEALRDRLLDLGCELTVIEKPALVGGYQAPRLAKVQELISGPGEYFVPSQYDNRGNPESYEIFAHQLIEALGPIANVVGPVGSGGSLCGTVRALRRIGDVRAIAVDTHGSVLFGQDDRPRLVRGLGNSLMPRNLDHQALDEVHWLDPAAIFVGTRRLHQQHGVYMGPTSGAAYVVAQAAARKSAGLTVAIMPDTGHRYATSVYHDSWLAEHLGSPLEGLHIPAAPDVVDRPPARGTGWQALAWNRGSRDQRLRGGLPGNLTGDRVSGNR